VHGTGLGLAIVQSVVSDHGGRVSVESEAGVGTSFHVHLPLKPPAHPRPVNFPVTLEENEAADVAPAAEEEKKEA
jgi:hypothetical protein